MKTKIVSIGNVQIGGGKPLALIAGPCVVENREMILQTAKTILGITLRLNIPFIFKSSYKKANRTSGDSFTTIGEDKALAILAEVKREFGVPILTDIHTTEETKIASEVVDVLQIPAFLCRQTELLEAAGRTGKVVNIKKGQFLAPDDMKLAAKKVAETGNEQILLTERGTTFGYQQSCGRYSCAADYAENRISGDLGCNTFRAIAGRRNKSKRWTAGIYFPDCTCRRCRRHRWNFYRDTS